MEAFLRTQGFRLQSRIHYQRTAMYSDVYTADSTCVIVDTIAFDRHAPCRYKEYTKVQNRLAAEYDYLYRFLSDDAGAESKLATLLDPDASLEYHFQDARRDLAHPENTPIEADFEAVFTAAFPYADRSFLRKEKRMAVLDGNAVFIDYFFRTDQCSYAVEINGETYHNPLYIGRRAYLHQLDRQNMISYFGNKILRFATENLQAKEETIEDLRRLVNGRPVNLFTVTSSRRVGSRRVTYEDLYAHQKEILADLHHARAEGRKAYLLHLPTATGKTHIALHDILQSQETSILVIVPTTAIKRQWLQRIQEKAFNGYVFEVQTYNYVIRHAIHYTDRTYGYVVIDEAHHAQAPTLSQVIRELQTDFLLGLTATDERLDERRLEDIFGTYETKMSIYEGIEKGILSSMRVYRLKSNVDLSEVRINGKEYVNTDLERNVRIDSRNELVADTLRKYAGYFDYLKGIVFCVNIAHAREMEKQLADRGFSVEAVYGRRGRERNQETIDRFKEGDLELMTTVNMLSEGFDAPSTNLLVMARPTLSKVVYLQQLGRGLRKAPGKEALYVIDVVDNYGPLGGPWTLNSVLRIPYYRPFMNPLNIREEPQEYLVLDNFSERELALKEIDIHTFEEKYGDMLSLEEAARELYVSTGTLRNWMRKGEARPDVNLPFGKRTIPLFNLDTLEYIRQQKGLKKRNEETIRDDFFEFIEEKTYTFSFKMVFMLALIKNMDNRGNALTEEVVEDYRKFYLRRIEQGRPVDRPNCVYDEAYLTDFKKITKNILDNPFEKFERKRFLFQSKDLDSVSFNPTLFDQLTEKDIQWLRRTLKEHLEEYYEELGGIDPQDSLFED